MLKQSAALLWRRWHRAVMSALLGEVVGGAHATVDDECGPIDVTRGARCQEDCGSGELTSHAPAACWSLAANLDGTGGEGLGLDMDEGGKLGRIGCG